MGFILSEDVVEVVVVDDVPVVVEFVLLPLLLLLLIEALNLELVSRAAAFATSLAFCSNVFAALEFKSNKCFELSFACCNVDFHESKTWKI